MNIVLATILACAAAYPAPNREAIAQVRAGEQKTAYASW